MRLIDLDKLLEFPIRENHYDRENGDIRYIFGIEAVLEYAESLPTVDAVPVRHGYWKETGNTTHYYTCSVCGKPGDGFDNYCRSCGAKMDADADADGKR